MAEFIVRNDLIINTFDDAEVQFVDEKLYVALRRPRHVVVVVVIAVALVVARLNIQFGREVDKVSYRLPLLWLLKWP